MRLIIAIFILFCSSTTLAAISNNGLHLDWLDKSVNPGTDFFAYANGNWQKHHPIPAAYSRWGTFEVLEEHNQKIIKNLVTTAENSNHPQGTIEQKVGDFYFSGMNVIAIDHAGIQPLQPEFNRINDIKNLKDLEKDIIHLQLIGVNALFDFDQMQDFKDSNQVIGIATQGGLSLPDRDYYLKKDARFKQIRKLYLLHMTKMFELLGDDAKKSAQEAKTVMNIETMLAQASMSRIEQRNPKAIYHIMNVAELEKITPHFSWQTFFSEINHQEINHINLAMPLFFKTMDTQLVKIPLDDWKVYLRWHLISSFSPFLSQPFVSESFRITSALTGAKKILPRWKRVINCEDAVLGFAIGKLYVEKAFPPSSKQAVLVLLNNIRDALKNDLQTLSWMTPATRQAAIEKLNVMEQRVGYPDKWRDYSALTIDRGPYVLNIIRANEFLAHYELNKIGKPLDKSEWDMTPQMVNAYYDPSNNRLNIPAGILQPPFFDPNAPAAVNYGAIGFVMGHEMTHGFDDEGAQFDEHGNLKNWWNKKDLQKFKTITGYIADQFSTYTINDNVHIQGKLVMGEATADLGGLILAYNAFHHSDAYKQAKIIDGFTPDQQFFLGAAHVWASNIRPEEARRLAVTDPHPPAIYRVNGTLANMPQFTHAYQLTQPSKMINKDSHTLW